MTEQKSTFYSASVGEAEKKRLEDIQYPHEVSRAVLGDLEFRSLIDAGSGPDIKLARYVVEERGAAYTGFDLGRTKVAGEEKSFATILREKLKAEGINARSIGADVRCISSIVGHADVVHERFVLMHLSEDDRRAAVGEILKIADRKAIFLEYDWRTMKSTKHSAIIDRFKEMSFEVMQAVHVNPFAGEDMLVLVRELAGDREVKFAHFLRDEGNISPEIAQLCRTERDVARKIGKDALAEEFDKLADQLESSPITMISAEIVVAIVSME